MNREFKLSFGICCEIIIFESLYHFWRDSRKIKSLFQAKLDLNLVTLKWLSLYNKMFIDLFFKYKTFYSFLSGITTTMWSTTPRWRRWYWSRQTSGARWWSGTDGKNGSFSGLTSQPKRMFSRSWWNSNSSNSWKNWRLFLKSELKFFC